MKRLALVLPIVLLASCGGGGGLSKADYIAKAEALCAKANADVKKLTFPTAQEGIGPYVGQIIVVAQAATDGLKALEPPKADKAALKTKVIDPLEAQIREGKAYQRDVAAAVTANDSATLGKLIQQPPTTTEADLEWMKTYGFKACVEAAKTG